MAGPLVVAGRVDIGRPLAIGRPVANWQAVSVVAGPLDGGRPLAIGRPCAERAGRVDIGRGWQAKPTPVAIGRGWQAKQALLVVAGPLDGGRPCAIWQALETRQGWQAKSQPP